MSQAAIDDAIQPLWPNRVEELAAQILIDTAMGQASHSLGDGSPNSVTLECKVNYIRPVTDGELRCRAWVVHGGRRTQVLEAEVHQGDKLIATAQATFICK